jgi:hypothetical protein
MFTILGLFEGTKERWERVGKKNERDWEWISKYIASLQSLHEEGIMKHSESCWIRGESNQDTL